MRIYLIVLITIAMEALSASNGVIAGRVQQPDGEPLPGATVLLGGTPYGAMTDGLGEYVIAGLQPGTYSITARMIGRNSITVEEVTVEANSVSRLDFELKEDASGSTVIMVTESRSHILRDIPSTVFELDLSDMRIISSSGIIDMISEQPGVIERNGSLHIRGGRSEEVDYVLEGVSLISPMDNRLGFDVPVTAISNATLMTGGQSIEYGNSMSGVVDLVAKEGNENFSASVTGRMGDVSSRMLASEVVVFSEGIDHDLCRTDLSSFEFSLSGTEPVTGSILPEIGINLPEKITFSLTGQMNFSGGNNVDTRGNWSYNWLNDASGILKLVYRPEAGSSISLSFLGSYRENGWNQWAWSNYGDQSCSGGIASPPGNLDYALPAMFSETHGIVLNTSTLLGNKASLNFTAGALRFMNWNRIYDSEGGFVGDDSGYLYWLSQYEPPDLYQDSSGFYRGGIHQNVWFDSQADVYSVDLGVDFNPNPRLRLKAGFGCNYYDLYQYNVYFLSQGSSYLSLWEEYPHSAFAYAQGSYRFTGGGIATLGIRGDYFDPNTFTFSTELGTGTEVESKMHASPRVSFSVPFGERSLFFTTYGHYFQLAPMNCYYLHTTFSTGADRVIAGNPALDPELTRMYEVGIRQELDRFTDLGISFYNKDITGLISTQDYSEGDYYIFSNDSSNGNAMGIETSINRRHGSGFSGQISYTFSIARGKYSSAFEEYNNSQLESSIQSREDNYLDWDQTHQAGVAVEYESMESEGPLIGAIRPFENSSIAIKWNYGSGTPYTVLPEGSTPVEVNTERRPFTMQTDLTLSREIGIRYGDFRVALSIFNIFDRKNIFNIHDTGLFHETGDPTGVMDNPRAWSAARHFLVSVVLEW
ncbi:MAG: TonB-dependent receptor [Candidatus Sabulitectum sp.]|nr:TonB-dependent receptor [Candidatus Sabulitectum sp.]